MPGTSDGTYPAFDPPDLPSWSAGRVVELELRLEFRLTPLAFARTLGLAPSVGMPSPELMLDAMLMPLTCFIKVGRLSLEVRLPPTSSKRHSSSAALPGLPSEGFDVGLLGADEWLDKFGEN